MFENIIEQGAAVQLREDILSLKHAPSMLFFGPPESGKGSCALEFARVLSCNNDGGWKCVCSACESHRYVQHSDLLMLGNRSFLAEIKACYSAFSRNPSSSGAKLLFIRSIRKLLLRFSPVLIEDSKHGKLSSVLQSIEEDLNEFETFAGVSVKEKLCNALLENAQTLAAEGISSNIPIDHIRRAGYWCRLAPLGKHKTLIIENAENMRDDARNSLLKLLEEPPNKVSIILTSKRREAIMPTILSRLRPYRFIKRSEDGEKEILRRVFQVSEDFVYKKSLNNSLLSAYLDSFLVQNTGNIYPLAAFFIASAARLTAYAYKKNKKDVPPYIISFGERYAPICEEAGFTRSLKADEIIKTLLEKSGNFEGDSFSGFLKLSLELVSDAARYLNEPQFIAYNDILRKYVKDTVNSVNIYNQNKTIALEALLYNIKNSLIRGSYG